MVQQNTADPVPITVLEPRRSWSLFRLKELVDYHELTYFLIWRDIKVRYKQTALGVAWAILQPLVTALVFTIFFGRVARVPSDDVPYSIFSYSGLVVWIFFAQAVAAAAHSVVSAAQVITKVYLPRITIPVAAVLACTVDLLVAIPILGAMMFIHGVSAGWQILTAPLFILLALVAALGTGLWLAALNVRYRDVRYVVPFAIQLWLFMTPVIYPASSVFPYLENRGLPAWLFGLNPMAGAVEGFRWATLGIDTLPPGLVAASVGSAGLLFVSGVLVFSAMERTFADVV